MSDLAPETLAELRRLYEAAFTVAAPENEWEEWTSKAAEAFPALLDAASERDRLAECVRAYGRTIDRWGLLIIAATHSEDITTPDGDGDWEVIESRLAEVPALLAERDALAAKVERVRALADEWTYKGEFGWDDGSHAYGTDCVVQALDYAAAELRRALDEEPQQ